MSSIAGFRVVRRAYSSTHFIALIRIPFCRTGLILNRQSFLFLVLTAVAIVAPAAAQRVELSIDVSKTGAKIDRNIFGQFAEHLGHGIYEGIWVGPDSAIPNTRGIRNDVVSAQGTQSPECSLAGGLLCRRISLAQSRRAST
jgi:hypothetical protein